MQALKTIVIGLGMALVLGFGLLIYGLTQNWHRLASTARTSAGWGDVALRQPATSRVRAMQAVGSHLILHMEDRDEARERLIVLDPANGAVVGTFWVTVGP